MDREKGTGTAATSYAPGPESDVSDPNGAVADGPVPVALTENVRDTPSRPHLRGENPGVHRRRVRRKGIKFLMGVTRRTVAEKNSRGPRATARAQGKEESGT
jgi:hypothetical protein